MVDCGMLSYMPQINATIKGLAAVVDNQPAAVRFFLRNWPVTLLAGAALAGRMAYRHKQKELTAYNVLIDVGSVIGPVASLFLMLKLAQEDEEQEVIQPAQVEGIYDAPAPRGAPSHLAGPAPSHLAGPIGPLP